MIGEEWAEGQSFCWLILVSWQISIEILGSHQPENCTIYTTKQAVIISAQPLWYLYKKKEILSSEFQYFYLNSVNWIYHYRFGSIMIFKILDLKLLWKHGTGGHLTKFSKIVMPWLSSVCVEQDSVQSHPMQWRQKLSLNYLGHSPQLSLSKRNTQYTLFHCKNKIEV